jgi:hypothetical protein
MQGSLGGPPTCAVGLQKAPIARHCLANKSPIVQHQCPDGLHQARAVVRPWLEPLGQTSKSLQ